MMVTRIKTAAVVCVAILAVGRLALATPESAAPVIKDFSSTGGNPQHKDNAKDLIYLVKPGDKITFSITTTEACKHDWKVQRGIKILVAGKKENVKQSSFTFTVPRRKANWDIEVEAYDRKAAAGPAKKAHRTWTITTSSLKTVKTGQSIQKAIDSLPADGGVVELFEGRYDLDSTLFVRKSNVTIRGKGKDETIIRNVKGKPIIYISLWENPRERRNYLYQKMIYKQNRNWFLKTARRMLKEGDRNVPINPPPQDKFVSCVVAEDFAVRGEGERKSREQEGLVLVCAHDCLIRRVKVEEVASYMVGWWDCFRVDMTDCKLVHNGVFDPFWSFGCNIIENEFINSWRFHGLKFNGGGLYSVRNNIWVNAADSVYFYGVTDTVFAGNVITGGDRQGIDLLAGHNNRIENNVICNKKAEGIYIHGFTGGASHNWGPHIIRNNVIYGNGKHGILMNEAIDTFKITIENNIIAKNGGAGFNIVDAGGSTLIVAHNNVWGNTGGNYKGIQPGAGDISADPLFTEPSKGDFHLKSKAGRWDAKAKKWVKDKTHSPCIDAGDPKSEFKNEPAPNGGRINMGAYGNTKEASKSKAAEVKGRQVFYNNSSFDGNNAEVNANDNGAIAADKTALLPGQTATFANYTSYNRGINGVMVDIAGLLGAPAAADFAFKVGNDNNLDGWSEAPAPSSVTVRKGAGADSSDRITIIRPDNAICNQWLQVTVQATAATGLAEPDVFYFGSAIGETGNSAADAKVDTTDEIRARLNPHNPAGIENPHDYNRDGVSAWAVWAVCSAASDVD